MWVVTSGKGRAYCRSYNEALGCMGKEFAKCEGQRHSVKLRRVFMYRRQQQQRRQKTPEKKNRPTDVRPPFFDLASMTRDSLYDLFK